jgi:protoporphyrinogen/coproporphyrinogen III oxidase
MTHVVVLGAGISGLSAAWFLKQRFGKQIQLTILEKSSRVGGVIQTLDEDEFLFETGPHSLRPWTNSTAMLKMIDQLHLKDQMILADPAAEQRYIYRKSRLQQVPRSVFGLLTSPFIGTCIGAVYRDLTSASSSQADESIYQFSVRKFGRRATEELIDPLVSGIYAGNLEKLSIRSCFPALVEWENKHGSITKALLKRKKTEPNHQIFSFKDGLETLPKAIGRELKEHIRLSTTPVSINLSNNKFNIATSKGDLIHADYVFSALPSAALAELVAPHHQEVAKKLQNIERASVAVVGFGFHQFCLPQSGFGYLVPRKEERGYLGMIWDSNVFPQQNRSYAQTRVTVMVGGAQMRDFDAYTSKYFVECARKAMSEDLGISHNPDKCHVTLMRQAIPQYNIGHSAMMHAIQNELKKMWPRMICIGTDFVGISVNECIAKSAECVDILPLS